MKRFLLSSLCLVGLLAFLENRIVAEDDFSAIQNAITESIQQGPDGVVTLEAGKIYRLGSRPEANGTLTIIGADGLTLDGNGAMLLAHPTCMVFGIAKSRNVTIKNLVIDYDPLPYTQAVIQSVAPESGTLTFSPMSGYADPVVSENYGNSPRTDVMFYHGDTRKMTHTFLRMRAISQNDDGTFSLWFHGDSGQMYHAGSGHITRILAGLKPGDFLTVKLPFPYGEALRDADGRFLTAPSGVIRAAFCQDVRIENVTLFSSPGQGFVATGSEGMVLDRFRIMRKPGTDRLASICSDGGHFKSVTRMPKLTGCYFEGMMDDGVNVKVSSAKVLEKNGKKLVIGHNDIAWDDIAMEPGMRVSFYDFEAKRHLGFAVLDSVNRTQYRLAEVDLDEDIPGISPGHLLYTCPVDLLEINDCIFKAQFNNALLIRPAAIIRHCHFEDVNVAVHAIAHEPIEGPMPPGLMTVEYCTFTRCTDAAIGLFAPSREAVPEGSQALKLSHSRFVLPHREGIAIRSHNRTGIEVNDISIESDDGDTPAAPIRKF